MQPRLSLPHYSLTFTSLPSTSPAPLNTLPPCLTCTTYAPHPTQHMTFSSSLNYRAKHPMSHPSSETTATAHTTISSITFLPSQTTYQKLDSLVKTPMTHLAASSPSEPLHHGRPTSGNSLLPPPTSHPVSPLSSSAPLAPPQYSSSVPTFLLDTTQLPSPHTLTYAATSQHSQHSIHMPRPSSEGTSRPPGTPLLPKAAFSTHTYIIITA